MEFKQITSYTGGNIRGQYDISIGEKSTNFPNRFKNRYKVGRYIGFFINSNLELCFKFSDTPEEGYFTVSNGGVYNNRICKTPNAFSRIGVPTGKFSVRQEGDYFIVEDCKIPDEEYRKL